MPSDVRMSLTVSGAELRVALANCALARSRSVETSSGVVLKESLLGGAAVAKFCSRALETVFQMFAS